MATKEEVKEAIYDELVGIISSETSVSDADDHVNLLNERGSDAEYPFLGFEMFGAPNNVGFDGNVHVDDVVYSSGEIDHVVYRFDTTLTTHIGVLTNGDPHLKDQLYTAVQDTFGLFTARNDYSDLHGDVTNVEGGGYSDLGDDDLGIHGDRIEYEIDYSRYLTVSDFVPIRELDVTVEHLDEGTVYHSWTVTS